jgi:acetate CoA/acetoacetate CoA-transferase beta subunit
LVVTEMAVISFPGGRATLIETAPGVSTAQILEGTEAELVISSELRQMQL